MKIEHVAFNVDNPVEVAKWYTKHLGLKIVKQAEEPPFMTFLADDSGQVMIEIYKNPPNDIPDYSSMNPLQLHLAFVSNNPQADKERLLTAGATEISDDILEDGSRLVMLRDPWGLALQLCKRAAPMLRDK
jgi:glyoxylase I family protein